MDTGHTPGSALTKAQRRVLDFLRADTTGEFIDVPFSVTRYTSPLDALVAAGLVEQRWQPAPLPPGSYTMVYRAVSGEVER